MAERVADAVERRASSGARRDAVRRAYLTATPARRAFAGFGKRARPLEGFLFPATYDFFENDDDAAARRASSSSAFRTNWAKVDLRYARSKNLTPYDVLIIASMIEKETSSPSERPLVAAVIYNRLQARMPLGIDATIRYGLDIPPTESITKSQLAARHAVQHAQVRTGLPPTPIANPGLASMQAAAHPAKVDYLYFVRKPDSRSHFFTASVDEFDAYTRRGLPAADRRDAARRAARRPGRALALAADAERRLRRARARLGLRRRCSSRPERARGRGARARRARLRRRERDGAAQARGRAALRRRDAASR